MDVLQSSASQPLLRDEKRATFSHPAFSKAYFGDARVVTVPWGLSSDGPCAGGLHRIYEVGLPSHYGLAVEDDWWLLCKRK